jgi:hypothetical protein
VGEQRVGRRLAVRQFQRGRKLMATFARELKALRRHGYPLVRA